jgi:predicted ATPase/class 3 adenylate cyclase/DNA-binding CsgD family transcriptional regulator
MEYLRSRRHEPAGQPGGSRAIPRSGDVGRGAPPQDSGMTVRTPPPSWLDELVATGAAPDQPSSSLPIGTVTFLLTDVEGSTRGWEDAPDAMAAAIARHYELLDDAIVAHNGVRPVEQGEGDSVVGAFARASDAIAAALDAQRLLRAEAWPESASLAVRMAIHTGDAELREEGNYFGPTVIRCARLRAIGAGGQMLVSGPTADLVADRLPPGASLADLGHHRLKDLGRPERVFELRHADLPPGNAPLRSLDNLPNSLPVQLTSFVGRDAELFTLSDLLATTRLLSVNGAGGCGKTRLAIQLAADVLDRFPGGAWLVELATLTDPTRVAAAIASALGERDLSGDLVTAIAIRVGIRPTLIVLDNCEHLLDAAATFVDALLRRSEAVTVLATSREPLGVPGETAWRVPSMPAPDPVDTQPIDTLSEFDAVRLFLDRATKVRPNFGLTPENAQTVAQICYRLEGIPLALELAAARVRGLTVEQVAAGLDDRFRLLTGGARTVLPRQQTLQASVDWSYELLSDRERAAFRRLAVFAGGFTLDAAEQVCSGADIEPVEVLDLLVALVDKSMIDTDDARSRYRMLESLRQYATARLVAAGESTATRDAHLTWAARSIDPIDVVASDALDATEAFVDEIDNFRAAFEWAVATGDAEGATRCLAPLGTWEVSRGDPRAGVEVASRALAMPGASHRLVCLARASLSFALGEAGDAMLASEASGALQSELGDLDDDARCVCLLAAGYSVLTFGDFNRSFPLFEDALAAGRRAGRSSAQRHACSALALAHFMRGEWEAGEAYAAEVGADPRSSTAAAGVTSGREYAAWVRGHYDEARELIDLIPPGLSPRTVATLELLRLQVDLAQGTDSGAAARLESLIDEARRRGFTSAVTMLGWGPGIWRMVRDDAEEGARAVIAWNEDAPSPWGTFVIPAFLTLGRLAEAREHIEIERDMSWGAEADALRANLDTVLRRLEGDLAAAEQLGHDSLVANHRGALRPQLVHTLEILSGIAAAQESHVECARLAGAAQALRDDMGYVLRWPYETRLRAADIAAARAALGDEAFDAAFAAGHNLDDEAAVAYARRARGERKRPTVGWDSLTPTEVNVVRLVVSGLTNKEVGRELLMGAETVKTHLSHVYDELGIRSRAALATQFAGRS